MHVFTLGRLRIAAVIFSALLTGAAWGQSIRYVDDDADPNGDGVAWQTAYADLQAALDDAADRART